MGILVYRDRLGSRDLVWRIEYVRGVSASFCYDKDYLSRAKTAGELGISVPRTDILGIAYVFNAK